MESNRRTIWKKDTILVPQSNSGFSLKATISTHKFCIEEAEIVFGSVASWEKNRSDRITDYCFQWIFSVNACCVCAVQVYSTYTFSECSCFSLVDSNIGDFDGTRQKFTSLLIYWPLIASAFSPLTRRRTTAWRMCPSRCTAVLWWRRTPIGRCGLFPVIWTAVTVQLQNQSCSVALSKANWLTI